MDERGRSGMSLRMQIFAVTLIVSLAVILTVGLIARSQVGDALEMYWMGGMGSQNMMGRGRGGDGGMMMASRGAAEEELIRTIDRGMMAGAVAAVGVAGLTSALFARTVSKPLTQLTSAVQNASRGFADQLTHVAEAGPLEVATLARSYNELVHALAEAEMLRKRLVNDVAHELRNPLAAVRLQIEGMADGIVATDEKNLRSVVEDVEHLTALIGDLQELSLAEADKLSLDPEPVDMVELSRRALRSSQSLISEDVDSYVRADGGDMKVFADPRRISQVLLNLLSNAARNTAEGSIVVEITRGITSSSPDPVVRVTVIDTGSGISATDLPYVFERFYRADAARLVGEGGIGVGLTISERIIHASGGSMFVTSEEGVGTLIGFDLPAYS